MYFAKSVIGIFVALLLLASAGIAYAMWSETLKVNVYVDTGEVDVKWSSWECNDAGIDPGYDKDVGKCYVQPESEDIEGDVIKLNITLDNAYPSYNVTIMGEVDNIGSIPVEPVRFFFDSNENGEYDPGETEIVVCTDYPLDLDGDEKADVDFHMFLLNDSGDGTQIDPNESDMYGFMIHIKQNATELETYEFHIVMQFAQWNEA